MKKKNLKIVVTVFVVVPFLLAGYLLFFAKNTCVEWQDFVHYNGNNYQNTNLVINAELIGKELGNITKIAPRYINKIHFRTEDGLAGCLKAGTRIFEIKGYESKGYVGVEVDGIYYLYKAGNYEIPAL